MGARVTTAKAAVVLLVCVGLWVARPFAAQDAAALTGVVTDSTGAALPGVAITVTGDRGPAATAVTNERGEFHVLGLLPGKYTVAIELSGFRSERQAIEVVSGRTVKLAVRLEVGSLSETVTVSSGTLPVQTNSSSRSYSTVRRHEREWKPIDSDWSLEASALRRSAPMERTAPMKSRVYMT